MGYRLLGECLGILDYKNNIAAFWFLDTLALQVLKYSNNFDGQSRSIFVSWLAGEFKVIQGKLFYSYNLFHNLEYNHEICIIIVEKNPSREDFFSEINELFCNTAVKLVSGEPLLHWEKMFPKQNQENADDGIKEIMKERSVAKKNQRHQVRIV